MTISLISPISHTTDTQARLGQCGLNFEAARIHFRVRLLQTGETRDYFVGDQPGDIDTMAGFFAAFPSAANLRNNLESYVAARVAALGGNVT